MTILSRTALFPLLLVLALAVLIPGNALAQTATVPNVPFAFAADRHGDRDSRGLSQTGTAPDTATVTSSASPTVFGQRVTFTAVIRADAGGGVPAGAVTFLDGANALGLGLLEGGRATVTTTALSLGVHKIIVNYAGDATFRPSSGSVSQSVDRDGSALGLRASNAATSYGQSITLAATVAAAAPGSGTPTGVIYFKDGANTLGIVPLSAAGKAILTTTLVAVGTRSLTAVYYGDHNYTARTSPGVTHTVSLVNYPAPPISGSDSIGIMPMGDSLTYGYSLDPTALGGYRVPLSSMTTGAGLPWQYVGSVTYGPPGIGSCEGHSGYTIEQIQALAPQALAQYQPQVVLLQIGTNNLVTQTPAVALTKMAALLDTLLADAPSAVIYVASLTPHQNPAIDDVYADYNQGLPALVQARAASGAPIYFVDMHNLCGILPSELTDGVHPDASGYAKMANVWGDVLMGQPAPH